MLSFNRFTVEIGKTFRSEYKSISSHYRLTESIALFTMKTRYGHWTAYLIVSNIGKHSVIMPYQNHPLYLEISREYRIHKW